MMQEIKFVGRESCDNFTKIIDRVTRDMMDLESGTLVSGKITVKWIYKNRERIDQDSSIVEITIGD